MNNSIRFSEITWDFPKQGISLQGTGVVQLAFSSFSDVIPSITREAIQNSLDAAQPNGSPVKVKFAFKTIDISKDYRFDNLLKSAEEHIHLCEQKYLEKQETNKADTFSKMLSTIVRFRKIKRLPYLEISDYNTIGMYYDVDDPDYGRMSSFMHKDGDNESSNSNSSKGGGFNGIGKMAYFAMSPLNMVLASTHALKCDDDDPSTAKSFFAGTMKLVTHPCKDNKCFNHQYAGYFPKIPEDIAYRPLCNISLDDGFPLRFSRQPNEKKEPEMGTSFFIIGCEPTIGLKDDKKDDFENIQKTISFENEFDNHASTIYQKQMLPSILRNYFVAIKNGLLEIELGQPIPISRKELKKDSIKINRNNIDKLMATSFKTNEVKNFKDLQKSLNPRPFLESLASEMSDDISGKKIIHYELILDSVKELKSIAPCKTWGKVRFCININPEFSNNMIIAMRAPLMTVCKYDVENHGGRYAALLICDEEGNYANQLLRASEPPTHNSWQSEYASMPGHGESSEAAQALLETIHKWVENILDNLFPKNTRSDVYVGMRNVLAFYDPQDSTQRHQDLNSGAYALGNETTKIEIKKYNKKTNGGTKLSKVGFSKVIVDTNGGGRTGGGSNGSDGGNQAGVTNPKTKIKFDDAGKNEKIVTKIPLKVRSFISTTTIQRGLTYTVVVSGSPKKYDRIDMCLFAKGENSREALKIKSVKPAQGCHAKKKTDKIISFSIDEGQSVRFDIVFELDNMQYTLQAVSTIEAVEERIKNNQ